jgi:hypothetical protein
MFKRDKFKIGQVVRINDGVKDEDFDEEIGGWHGRIREIDAGNQLILIEFDSITLRNMPIEYVERCEEEGMSWAEYYIGFDDVMPVEPRDTKTDVKAAAGELAAQAGWAYLGEEGRAINAVLADIDIDDEMAQMEAWYDYFEEVLSFPFRAVVDEFQERGSPLRAGDRVHVLGLADADDLYGVLVNVKRQFSKLVFPLCDLKALDETSPNYDPVYLYALWFANR